MQLKIKRSQRNAGVLSNNVVFCLDARVEFTAAEHASLTRHKLWNQCIYNSEASKRLLDKSAAQMDGSVLGGFKSLATAALAGLRLNIFVKSLAAGQHVECKSMDELLGAEDAIMTACQNLRVYMDTAATFDGREVLFDFSTDEPRVVAQAVTPTPQLVAPALFPSMEPALLTAGDAMEPIPAIAIAEAYTAPEETGEVYQGGYEAASVYSSSANGMPPLLVVGLAFVMIVIVLALIR
ncbi:MAG: hypothetical protein JSR72_01520 [Proteobacteria bacterium]|nr:hypothetical protein [Pseudomonadota bacterium]